MFGVMQNSLQLCFLNTKLRLRLVRESLSFFSFASLFSNYVLKHTVLENHPVMMSQQPLTIQFSGNTPVKCLSCIFRQPRIPFIWTHVESPLKKEANQYFGWRPETKG